MSSKSGSVARSDLALLPQRGCPLCGGPNGCGVAAAGRFDVDCWCRHVTVAPEVLRRVPAQARGCVCPACAASASKLKPA